MPKRALKIERKFILKLECPDCARSKVWCFKEHKKFGCTKCGHNFNLKDLVQIGQFKSIEEAEKWYRKIIKERLEREKHGEEE